MRISVVSLQNMSQKYCNNKNTTNEKSTNIVRINPTQAQVTSFKGGIPWKILSLLIAKCGYEIKKDKKFFKEKENYYEFLNNPEKYKKVLAKIINSITESPIHVEEKLTYNLLKNDSMPTMEEMKKILITNILPRISDDTYSSMNIKKSCLEKLFNLGEYNNDEFLNYFVSLPDNKYINFKKSIIEKILYSVNNKNLAEQRPGMYHNYYNFQLINSLKDKVYASFLRKNLNGIYDLHDRLVANGKSLIKNEHNEAYKEYLHDFEIYHTKISTFMQSYKKEAFQNAIKNSKGNSLIFAQDLNIDESIAASILKDIDALKLAKQKTLKAEKLDIYKNIIQQKFKKPIVKILWYDRMSSIKKYSIYYEQLQDIKKFINDTEYSKELNQLYSTEIKSLQKKVNKLEKEVDRRNDTSYLDITERMDYIYRV